MAIIYALWLITSSYSTQLAVYPSALTCASVALSVNAGLEKPPRSVLGKLVCIPLVGPAVDGAGPGYDHRI